VIIKSRVANNKETNFECYVINQLGKRFEKLTVVSEKDCIRFKQKVWIKRQEWRVVKIYSESAHLVGYPMVGIAAG
jgi:hypothetical protein